MNLREMGAKALPTDLTCEQEFGHGFFVETTYCPESRYLKAVETAMRNARKGGRRKPVDEREVAHKVLAKKVNGWRGLNYGVLGKEGVLDLALVRQELDADAVKSGGKKLSDKAWEEKKAEELPFSPEDCAWLMAQLLDFEVFVLDLVRDPENYGLTGEDESKN